MSERQLREAIRKVASQHPGTRKHLLPLLKVASRWEHSSTAQNHSGGRMLVTLYARSTAAVHPKEILKEADRLKDAIGEVVRNSGAKISGGPYVNGGMKGISVTVGIICEDEDFDLLASFDFFGYPMK